MNPRLRRVAKRLLLVLVLVVAALGVAYAALPWADLRPEALRAGAPHEGAAERGRALLERVVAAHRGSGTETRRTVEIVAVDEWAGASAWWPANPQRFRADRLLGTFTSRVELLDGPAAGETWGLQSWTPYRIASGTPDPTRLDHHAAIEFYLPTLQYFDELPVRLLAAETVLDAGDAELRGRRYHRVFATWGKLSAHAAADQYLLWIDPESLRIQMATYTVREAVALSQLWMRPLVKFLGVGTIHFADYRDVNGEAFAFRQTVTLGSAEQAAEDLDRHFFHRLQVESVRFDAVEPEALLPFPGLPAPADAKPPA